MTQRLLTLAENAQHTGDYAGAEKHYRRILEYDRVNASAMAGLDKLLRLKQAGEDAALASTALKNGDHRKAAELAPNGCHLAIDKEFGMGSSKFDDPRLGVYCCGHMFRRERPALLVVREDGDWQFLCGGVDHNDPREPYHVSVGVLLDVDPTLHQIADLPPEWEAERTEIGGNWLRTVGAQ